MWADPKVSFNFAMFSSETEKHPKKETTNEATKENRETIFSGSGRNVLLAFYKTNLYQSQFDAVNIQK